MFASRSLGRRLPRSLTGSETALRMHKDVATDAGRDMNSESRSQFRSPGCSMSFSAKLVSSSFSSSR